MKEFGSKVCALCPTLQFLQHQSDGQDRQANKTEYRDPYVGTHTAPKAKVAVFFLLPNKNTKLEQQTNKKKVFKKNNNNKTNKETSKQTNKNPSDKRVCQRKVLMLTADTRKINSS